jgi:uncharacterized protein (DUF58 family)
MLAVRNNDRVGLTVFDHDVELYIPPKKGRKHVLRLVTEVLGHTPRRETTNLSAALQYVTRVLKRKAIVFVVSDFLDDLAERELGILSRRHDVVPVVITDEREQTWRSPEPDSLWKRLWHGGLLDLHDLETGERRVLDTGSRRQADAFEKHVEEAQAERARLFARLRLDTIEFGTELPSETDYVRPLLQFFRRRTRRS